MTISTDLTKITYQANGATTLWTFNFPGGPDPDIQVYITAPDGTLSQVTTNVLVGLNPPIDPNPTSISGAVRYPVSGAPLAVGNQITLIRAVPYLQPFSFANQGTLYPVVIEKAFDWVVMQIEQLVESISRTLRVPLNEGSIGPIPPIQQRAGRFLAFDGNGQPTVAGDPAVAGNNAIRVPSGEIIPPLPPAAARPGQFITFDAAGNPILVSSLPPNVPPLFGSRVTISSAHTVVNAEKGFLFQLNGNTFFDFSLGSPTSYDTDFSIAVFNADLYTGPASGRAKRILFNGTIMPGGLLWPGQWIYIFRYGSTWVSNPRDQRWKPGVSPTFYVDPILGKDDGTTDGLAVGSGATKTVGVAVAAAVDRVDYGGLLTSGGATIQLATGGYTENIVINFPTVGGLPITIKGADDGASPAAYQIQILANATGIRVDNAATVNIKGLNFLAAGDNVVGIEVIHSSTANISNCRFDQFPGAGPGAFHIWVLDGSTVMARNLNIAGGCQSSLVVQRHSTLRLSGQLIVGSGLFFNVFTSVFFNSSLVGGPGTFGDQTDYTLVGGAGCTGYKFLVQVNSVGMLGTGGMDALPGGVAGIIGGAATRGGDASMII
jgi:hypothetical protein